MFVALGKRTSKDLCDILKKTYAKPSAVRTMQLRSRLCELKQGDLSISEYCNQALFIKDELAAIGKENDEFLCQVLTNLKSDLSEMRMSILARQEVPDFEEVIDFLVSAESMVVRSHLPSLSMTLLSPDPPSTASAFANTVQRTPAPASDSAQGFGRGSARGRGGYRPPRGRFSPSRGRGNFQRDHLAITCPQFLNSSPSAHSVSSKAPRRQNNWYPDTIGLAYVYIYFVQHQEVIMKK
ncbi:hypothetical protein LIER_41050 [Lithospermum erythrorhizon]|uniref:Retrotransposon gag domain-containing protein n=1 Tax=Lithospermum erythrorhizon TaxID=34254 RepID=A0AAV3R6Q0_LITER